MTHCPQAILEVTVDISGNRVRGYSGDCLPPLWFDKTPNKSFDQQIHEMQEVMRQSAIVFRDHFRTPQVFFPAWRAAYSAVQQWAANQNLPALLASFGISMLERAMIDAMLRHTGKSFFDGARENVFGIEAGQIHSELNKAQPRDWLPATPRDRVYVRHTVGLSDPLTRDQELTDDPADGFPVTLEEHLRDYGIRYLKIKVSNQLAKDLDRLRRIAELVERFRGRNYHITLDGNEQYTDAAQLDELITTIEDDSSLHQLWANSLVIEQPLARNIALDPQHVAPLAALAARKPIIIDESDGELDSFAEALRAGYRGVSSKNCKGPIKSLLNAALIWHHHQNAPDRPLVMTAEDLCTVGVVPVQSDLSLIATLGIEHVERNGHHYHPGLSYLPPSEQEAALQAHGDLYERRNARIAPRIVDGQFHIRSLHAPGFGFLSLPDMNARELVWEQ